MCDVGKEDRESGVSWDKSCCYFGYFQRLYLLFVSFLPLELDSIGLNWGNRSTNPDDQQYKLPVASQCYSSLTISILTKVLAHASRSVRH